jgi:hypothetical protein
VLLGVTYGGTVLQSASRLYVAATRASTDSTIRTGKGQTVSHKPTRFLMAVMDAASHHTDLPKNKTPKDCSCLLLTIES